MLSEAEHWARIKKVFAAASDLPPEARAEFLEKSCEGDAAFRREVESLLRSDSERNSPLDQPALSLPADLFPNLPEETAVGGSFGAYQILREIGRGGLGVVYLGERADEAFQKRVAIKLIRRGLDTEDILRRFRNERQILAQLEHPNIARLLDGGTTAEGQPFFVMEFVEGEPLLDYCEAHQLTLGERLELFRKICAAVTYAHQNLVIHRDLKPSNILVTGEGEPKLLDFGIARLLTSEDEDFTMTAPAARVLTPGYASPEQIRGDRITTASDVYSLGVLLYELLAGQKPYRLTSRSAEEFSRAITEQEPERPSTAVRHDSRFTIHDSRRLTGDLDNIVLMALRKEPGRRYSSVENLSEDIRRHRRGLPIAARPQTFSYRAGKFIKRNRAAVLASIFVLLAIAGGIGATFWQARVAQSERDRARLEATKATTVSEFMRNVLNFSNPIWLSSNPKRNREATISDALDEALKKIDADLAGEPEIQAEILLTIGRTYVAQAQYDKAAPVLRQSAEKFDQVFGQDNPKSMQAYGSLGSIFYLTGKHSQAEEIYHRTLNFYRSHPTHDENQIEFFAIDLNDYANIQNYKSNFPEAEKCYREALELGRHLSGKNRGMLPSVLGNLAWLLHSKGQFDEALGYYNQARQELRAAGNEDKLEAGTLFNKMGVAYTEMGNYAEAEIYYQKAYEILMKTVGAENFYTVATMYRHAYNLYKQGKLEEAETLVSKSLAIQHKIFPKGHNLTAYSERLVGEIQTKKGELEKGEETLRKALDYLSKKAKGPNRDLSLAKLSLGENLIAQKEYAEAEPFINSALEGSIKVVGESHPFTLHCREVLSELPK